MQFFIDKCLLYSMEKKTDLFNELVDDLQIKTKEYLQVVIGHDAPSQPIWYLFLILKGFDDAYVFQFCLMNIFQPNPTVRAKMAAVKVEFSVFPHHDFTFTLLTTEIFNLDFALIFSIIPSLSTALSIL